MLEFNKHFTDYTLFILNIYVKFEHNFHISISYLIFFLDSFVKL